MTPASRASTPPDRIRWMFDGIADRYDLLNSLLSLGQHRAWKERAADACRLRPGALVLDVCTGTGDIALALVRRGARAVALDFARRMMHIGRAKAQGKPVAFVCGDALLLPFADDAFDAATVGFSLRNVASVAKLLAEMVRVVRPGGWVVSLETSQPPRLVVRALYRLYLEITVGLTPLLSQGSAYRHLLRTIVAFPGAQEIAERFREAGLEEVSVSPLLLGAAAIHAGRVPAA